MSRHTLIGSAIVVLAVAGFGCSPSATPAPTPAVNAPVTTTPVPTTKAFSPFDTRLSMNFGDTLVFSETLAVTLEKIEDSRCPPDVQCVWAGELSATLRLDPAAGGGTVTLGTLTAPTADAGAYGFTLNDITETSIALTVTKR